MMQTHKQNISKIGVNWLDGYQKYLTVQVHSKNDVSSDVSNANLKEWLSCKPFEWYLKEIYPQLYIPEDKYSIQGKKSGFDPQAPNSPILNHLYL